MKLRVLAAAAIAAALPFAMPASAFAQAHCNRECLRNFADDYVFSILTRDPSRSRLANGATVMENLAHIDPGQGLWDSVTGRATDLEIHVIDTDAQQVGYMGVFEENGAAAQVGIRLKIDGGVIVEAEHLVARGLVQDALASLQAPRPGFTETVAIPYRDSRGRIVYMAERFYDALDNNTAALAPLANDCVRRRNGAGAAIDALEALGCAAQIDSNMFEYVSEIANRRVLVADDQTGLVLGLSHFHHAMDQEGGRTPIHGVDGLPYRDMSGTGPFDMPAFHLFKIWGGEIHQIEAIGVDAPYMSPTGWEGLALTD